MIYFITQEDGKYIKIGYTGSLNSVKRRVATLQGPNPHKVVLLGTIHGGKKAEKYLHNLYKQDSARGEWFDGEPIIDMVTDLVLDPFNGYMIEAYQIHAEMLAAVH